MKKTMFAVTAAAAALLMLWAGWGCSDNNIGGAFLERKIENAPFTRNPDNPTPTPTTYTLTTYVSPSGGGSVSRSPNQTSYNSGTNVTVTATAASGYTFTGWSGASTSTSPSVTITMNGDRELTANFRQQASGGVDGGPLSYGGRTYRTVVIGGKRWMAENLDYQTGNSWCYSGDNSNCNTYGRLYDWSTAMEACPWGWHLSTRGDWDALVTAAGGSSSAGKKLKATSGWNSGGNGTDDLGFTALPGGTRTPGGTFRYAGSYGSWWTAEEYYGGYAYNRYMDYDNDYVGEDTNVKGYGFSVRCVENE